MTDHDALVVLNAIPGLTSTKITQLVDHYGSASSVLQQNYADLCASGFITSSIVENIIHFSKDKFLSDEYNQVQQKGVHVITVLDEDFPHLLREIPGAPVVLYILGKKKILHSASIAMVGSRICSHYGKNMAERFAESFAQAGLVVTSGMARGIDTSAHQGCLKAQGSTIAVLGCGLNHVYPRENHRLMEQIQEQGAVISEMPLNTPALPANFPRRNRIITGLSLATLVVEAAQKSGALISATYALEQGRDVFALPANIDYVTAQGNNQLLKDGAIIALTPQDVLEELKGQMEMVFPALRNNISKPRQVLNEIEMKIYKILSTEPQHVDELADIAQLPIGQMLSVMLHLQLKGLIEELPGKHFVKS